MKPEYAFTDEPPGFLLVFGVPAAAAMLSSGGSSDLCYHYAMKRAICDIRAIVAATTVLILLSSCGQSSKDPAPTGGPAASRADVTVTFDGKRHKCLVALSSEAQGSSVPCGDVAAFVREELRVPSGAMYDIRKIPDVDESDVAKVSADLNNAGYRRLRQ